MSFGLEVLAEVVGGAATAGLLGAVVGVRDARATVERHDAEVAALLEDAGRFLRDRDRLLGVELRATTNDRASRGLHASGEHLAALASLKRQALHEYRDEMTRKLRRYREIRAGERRLHGAARHGREIARFELTDGDREILAGWRADATAAGVDGSAPVDDPTSIGREPDLRRFEAAGEPSSRPYELPQATKHYRVAVRDPLTAGERDRLVAAALAFREHDAERGPSVETEAHSPEDAERRVAIALGRVNTPGAFTARPA